MLFKDIVNRNARMYPHRIATVQDDTRYNFLEFKQRVNKIANALMAQNVVKGDRVAVLLRNCSEYIELHFGIPQGGMVIVPLNYRNREIELSHVINDSGANTLFVGSDYVEIIDSIRGEIKGVKNLICVGNHVEGYMAYEELLSNAPDHEPDISVNEDEVSALIYTSGTTGRSKGAMITQKNVLTEIYNHLATIPISSQDVGLNFFPLYHIGFVRSPTYMAMGAPNICAGFEPELACQLIEKERVTQTAMSPAQVTMFVNFPEIGRYDLGSLRKIISGGGHTSLVTLKKLFEIVSEDFDTFWVTLGMTEACACVSGKIIHRKMLNDLEENMRKFKGRKPSGVTVGTAYPFCEVRVVDDNIEDLPPWGIGEIIAKGDNIMKGYWQLPEATSETLRDGWFHSGDLGLFTDEGDIYVVDRKKDMILSGDENIYPAEVEEVLHSHPSILEAAVIGIPDKKWGETVKAIVSLRPETSATAEEIIEFCKKRLSSYKKPTSVDFLDQLPRNPSGKVLKTELRKNFL